METRNMNLEAVLDVLDLTNYFPGKITQDLLYQITELDFTNVENKPEKIAWQFIRKIVHRDYNARVVRYDKIVAKSSAGFREKLEQQRGKLVEQIHPLDIVVAVFICCDPIARQDIVTHLWECRLAIPFILPPSCDHDNTLSAYIWPLRSLEGLFRQEDGEFIETSIIDQPFNCIGFMKIGEISEWSKSNLLNCLIWGSEKTHPSFYHRNCKGSKKSKSDIVDGLVEIFWYLPGGEVADDTEHLVNPTLILNLRGDAIRHKEQVDLIGKQSSLTIILTDLHHFDECVQIVEALSRVNSSALILLANDESDGLENIIKEPLARFKYDTVEVLAIKGKMLPDVLELMHQNIHSITTSKSEMKTITLSNYTPLFENNNCKIDENNQTFTEVFEVVNDICKQTETISETDRKNNMFPLQELFWKEWAEKDRDFWRYYQMDDKERKQFGDRKLIQDKLVEIRTKQFEHFKNTKLAFPMKLFLQALVKFCPFDHLNVTESNRMRIRVFLRFFKLRFNKVSKARVANLNKEYSKIFAKMSSTFNTEQKQSLKMSLIEIENKKSKVFFSMENILREMGQIYEACESANICDTDIPFQSDDLVSISHTVLPKYACLILQEGYSFEILDGDANSVPLVWVRKVFKEFSYISCPNKPSKIHVISVLGIQSSGKSTFLNTVFGMQFPVSAGRCTRGAFVQVVKVHPSAHAIIKDDLDYIFVVDTEGLKSVLLSPTESIKHDNELSTFAIGSSQTTVINLMSENSTYLSENLPIVVHAFLRMFMVKLHRRCVIVHHNMDKSNKNKLLEQEMSLRNILDELTKRACELEQLPRLQFEDIIQFDIQNHTNFIPSLLEGKLPMAPISASYSREAYITKRNILNLIPTDIDKDCIESSAAFSDSLGKLWTAIKKDRFVYEYRNTSEICLKLEVDFDYLEILRDVLNIIFKETNICISEVQNESSKQKEIVDRFSKFIDEQRVFYTEQLKETFLKRKLPSDLLTKLNQKYIDNLQREFDKSKKSFENQIHMCLKQRNIRKVLLENINLFENLLKQNDNHFNKAWEIFIDKVLKTPDYLHDAVSTLQLIYPVCRNKIERENIERSPLLKDFVVDTEIHINQTLPLTHTDINSLVKKMYVIKDEIVAEFDSTIAVLTTDIPVYTSLITKQILLGIDTSLRQKLKREDNSMLIGFQYKIDVLMSVAKTYGRKITQLYAKRKDIQNTKFTMRNIMLTQFKREREDSEKFLELLGKSIVNDLNTKLEMTVIDAVMKSCIRQKITTKMFAIGHFMKYLSFNPNAKILKEYLQNPARAFKHYLMIVCKEYVSETFIQNDLQFYVRLRIEDVWNAIENEWKRERELINQAETDLDDQDMVAIRDDKSDKYTCVTLKTLIKVVAKETCLPREFKHVAEKSLLADNSNKKLDMRMLRENILEKIEDFIKQQVEILKPNIIHELVHVGKTCSKQLFKGLVGCTECCGKCNEMCILSENHIDDHIYILHRPTANADDFDHINISCVWKRLAHQCLMNGFNISLQQQHEDWGCISHKEVSKEIEKVFKLE